MKVKLKLTKCLNLHSWLNVMNGIKFSSFIDKHYEWINAYSSFIDKHYEWINAYSSFIDKHYEWINAYSSFTDKHYEWINVNICQDI